MSDAMRFMYLQAADAQEWLREREERLVQADSSTSSHGELGEVTGALALCEAPQGETA